MGIFNVINLGDYHIQILNRCRIWLQVYYATDLATEEKLEVRKEYVEWRRAWERKWEWPRWKSMGKWW